MIFLGSEWIIIIIIIGVVLLLLLVLLLLYYIILYYIIIISVISVIIGSYGNMIGIMIVMIIIFIWSFLRRLTGCLLLDIEGWEHYAAKLWDDSWKIGPPQADSRSN